MFTDNLLLHFGKLLSPKKHNANKAQLIEILLGEKITPEGRAIIEIMKKTGCTYTATQNVTGLCDADTEKAADVAERLLLTLGLLLTGIGMSLEPKNELARTRNIVNALQTFAGLLQWKETRAYFDSESEKLLKLCMQTAQTE